VATRLGSIYKDKAGLRSIMYSSTESQFFESKTVKEVFIKRMLISGSYLPRDQKERVGRISVDGTTHSSAYFQR